MSDVLLDTNVWFAYFVKGDAFHHEANKLVTRPIREKKNILLPEIVRIELLNALTQQLMNHSEVERINESLRNMSPCVESRHGDSTFWDEVLPANLTRLFLKPLDFIVSSYALHFQVSEFYSFDEKLNRALRRLKPHVVKLKIRKGRVTES